MYERIPAELRSLRQWVLWALRTVDGKQTKVPINPHTGAEASVIEPETWSSFGHCLEIIRYFDGRYGLGFVFVEGGGYAGLDLDDPNGKPEKPFDPEHAARVLASHQRIAATFNSYAEWSPSGRGMHIIIRANGSGGRRKTDMACELYFSKRFFTFTGNVANDAPITDYNELATVLFNELGGAVNAVGSSWDGEQAVSDEELINRAASAANGELFRSLFSGNWQGLNYPSQSEADQALMNIICFYTDNREQARRLFLQSGLGQRDKAQKRPQYVNDTISKAFDRKIETTNTEELRNQLLAIIQKSTNAPSQIVEPDRPTVEKPTGLLGEVAEFIYASSPLPVADFSLIGAVGLLAGIVGRGWNFNGAGLSQYMLLVAKSGRGKEAMASGISSLMNAVIGSTVADPTKPMLIEGVPAATTFLGPSQIASAPALMKHLQNNPCFVSVIGEFGMQLRKWTSERANPNDHAVRQALLDLYGKSGANSVARETIYSKKEENTTSVRAPALTLLGETTPERFYELVTEDLVAEGFLPRFLIWEWTGHRVPTNYGASLVKPPQPLIRKMRELCAAAIRHARENITTSVQAEADVQQAILAFDEFCTAQINKSPRESITQLWNRANLKLIKLAALYAVSDNYMNPVVTMRHFSWARSIVLRDVQSMLKRFETGDVGAANTSTKQQTEILRVMREYLTKGAEPEHAKTYRIDERLRQAGIVPLAYISRRLAASSTFKQGFKSSQAVIKDTMKDLADMGQVHAYDQNSLWANFASKQVAYVLDPNSVAGD